MVTSCRLSLMSLQEQSDPDQVTSIFKLSTASMCTELVDTSGITVLETRHVVIIILDSENFI